MTIGVAIPTFNNHIFHLKKLLSVISESTFLPKQVSISISSHGDEIIFDEYPFELIITKTKDVKNPCENRNIASEKLNTDIISFIDGDDIPHIKRLEYILKSFEKGAKVVVHNYIKDSNSNSEWYKSDIGSFNYFHEYIDQVVQDLSFPVSSKGHKDYHCAHISLKREISEKIKYNESIGWFVGEDGEYARQIVSNRINISYIENHLSQYVKN